LFITILLLSACVQALTDKIKVDFNYASMCPASGRFIISNLGPSLDMGLLDMIDLTIVPYGNAQESKNEEGEWVFTCEHKDDECYGNIMTNCVMDQIPESINKAKAVVCIEQHANYNNQGFIQALYLCAEKFNYSEHFVSNCMGNQHGNALQHAAAIRTPSDLQYVPWLIVDGSHPDVTEENVMLGDIFSWACKKFEGDNKPVACHNNMNKSVDNQIRSLSSQITAEN